MQQTAAVASLSESVDRWPEMFQDLNNGGDTKKWQQWCADRYAPAVLFGQNFEKQGITVGRVIDDDEVIELSFPCMFDDDPVQRSEYAGPGTKVRFHGSANKGAIFVTATHLKIAEHLVPMVNVASIPLAAVTNVNELKFKFSTLSMTSVGPGFELIARDGDEQLRLLLRFGLTPRPGNDILAQLRQRIGQT